MLFLISLIFSASRNHSYKSSSQIQSSSDTIYTYNDLGRKIGMIIKDNDDILEINVYPKKSENFHRSNFYNGNLTRYGEYKYIDSGRLTEISLIRYQNDDFFYDSGLDTLSVTVSKHLYPPNGKEMIYGPNGKLRQIGYWEYDHIEPKSVKTGIWSFYYYDMLFRQVKYSRDTIQWVKNYSLLR